MSIHNALLCFDQETLREAGLILRQLGLSSDPKEPVPPDVLASGWKLLLNWQPKRSREDEKKWAVVHLVFAHAIQSSTEKMESAFNRARLRFDKSRREIFLRAASKCFGVGRSEIIYGSGDRRILEASREFFDKALEERDALSEQQLRMSTGMRGVARLILSRGREDINEIEKIFQDISESYDLGNNGQECLEYLRECAIRRLELGFDHDAFDCLEEFIERGGVKDRQYFSDLFKFHSFAISMNNDDEDAIAYHIEAAIEACSSGFRAPDPQCRTQDAILHCFRGHISSLRWSFLRKFDDRSMLADIDEALPDLRLAAAARLGGADISLALLRRSNLLLDEQRSEAHENLAEAEANLGLADPQIAKRLAKQIDVARLSLSLKSALEADDAASQLQICDALLNFEESSSRSIFLVLICLRQLWATDDSDSIALSKLGRKAIELTELQFDAGELKGEHGGRCLSYAAGLAKRLDGESPRLETLRLHQLAIEQVEEPAAALLGQTADLALKLAKRLNPSLADEAAADLYRDAIANFERSIVAAVREGEGLAEEFLPAVVHSKLGEAYVRAGRFVAGPKAYQQAIFHFEKSRALGNSTPEISGLLGDAYYREANANRDIGLFRQALTYKLDAHSLGHRSRESFSVVARIHSRIFDATSDPSDLALALKGAASALEVDAGWPWPYLQLAAVLDLPSEAIRTATDMLDLERYPVLNLVRNQDRQTLLDNAIIAAVNNREFSRLILGGRSSVYALDDPHQLLSATMVLKPTTRKNAQREISSVKGLQLYLGQAKCTDKFILPKPLAQIDFQDPDGRVDCIYAMERAKGIGLDRVIFHQQPNGYGGAKEVTLAVEFLAKFHDWKGIDRGGKGKLQSASSELERGLDNLGLGVSSSKLIDLWMSLLPQELPVSGKKDAHPENWLVDRSSNIIMIDLEASAREIVFRDLAQLIDDYPVFQNDHEGWSNRLALVDRYVSMIGLEDMSTLDREKAYTAFAILRIIFGLSFTDRKLRSVASSGGRRRLHERRSHYIGMAKYLINYSRHEKAIRFCKIVVQHWHDHGSRFI